jgi:hypothetical protein
VPASHPGAASGQASQGSALASRHGIAGGVRGGCIGGGPGGGGGATKRARASSYPGKALLSFSLLIRTATVSSSSLVSSGGRS